MGEAYRDELWLTLAVGARIGPVALRLLPMAEVTGQPGSSATGCRVACRIARLPRKVLGSKSTHVHIHVSP
jgi:hypothetical protein